MRQARDHARATQSALPPGTVNCLIWFQSRREFLLLVPLKLTLEMMRGNNGIVNKMEF
jgi:hypothetical protein